MEISPYHVCVFFALIRVGDGIRRYILCAPSSQTPLSCRTINLFRAICICVKFPFKCIYELCAYTQASLYPYTKPVCRHTIYTSICNSPTQSRHAHHEVFSRFARTKNISFRSFLGFSCTSTSGLQTGSKRSSVKLILFKIRHEVALVYEGFGSITLQIAQTAFVYSFWLSSISAASV